MTKRIHVFPVHVVQIVNVVYIMNMQYAHAHLVTSVVHPIVDQNVLLARNVRKTKHVSLKNASIHVHQLVVKAHVVKWLTIIQSVHVRPDIPAIHLCDASLNVSA